MRLIPGNTKVQIEIFKGITLWDLLVGALAIIILALIVASTLPFKMVFIAIHLIISVLLLSRMDKEPNYMYLVKIIRHFGYRRAFDRLEKDKDILKANLVGEDEATLDELFPEEEEVEEVKVESKKDRKARLKAEKKERKADDKLLKSKKLSKEEEDAIWLKRANQSQAKKQAKKTQKVAKAKAKGKTVDKFEDMEKLSSFSNIEDKYISYHGKYFGAVLEIPSIEFKFFSEYRRVNSIENSFGAVLRSIKPDYCFNIVKIERPINYHHYIDLEYGKLDELRKSFEQAFITEDELQTRVAIIYDRIEQLQGLETDNKIVVPFYYLVFFDSDKRRLDIEVSQAQDQLKLGEMSSNRLGAKELALFLKYSNSLDFDEAELDKIKPEDYAKWAMPERVVFKPRIAVVDGIATHNFRVANYPNIVGDAWLAGLMTYPSTKVVIKVKPMDSGKAIRSIDKSLSELRATAVSAKTDSEAMKAQTHLESLQILLDTLQNDNESLLNFNAYVTGYDIQYTENNPKLETPKKGSYRSRVAEMKKTIRRTWSEDGFKLSNNEFDQAEAFIASQISGYDPMANKGRGIPSNTVSACFPWIYPAIQDQNGVQLGSSQGVPVFVDFFERNSERVNSNMVIVGKSGSGKSFATKTILSNLAADDAKIFVLDPEDEYRTLAKNLHGKFINVATNQYGRLNPFHIITNLDDDEGNTSSSYATHLQFLEEFFKQILPDCDKDSLEYLNTLVDRIYKKKGINPDTDLSKLSPEAYPIFDDLYDEILREFQRTQNEYIKTMLRTLMNYVSKFSSGGRNSVIWNGPSSITTEENFTVFNFQSLLANRNATVANAQMLLVLKYIDNEICKNRDYNEKYGLNRKVVVVIDEAHVFIDTKYPVALDFMFQLAKRIRKYNGMQIVITQNIKDFVGSEEIARKSTAIINACQYSFIFALSPNDMDDLCQLYDKAGGINENEQEQIVQAPRGQAFTIMSPTSRSTFKLTAPSDTRTMFSKSNYENPYFTGLGGVDNWQDFLGDSLKKRKEAVKKKNKNAKAEVLDDNSFQSNVSFDEISESDFIEELEAFKAENEVQNQENASGITFSEELFNDAPEVMLDEDVESNSSITFEEEEYAPFDRANTAASSKTEEILAGLVEKLGTQQLSDEIQRAVKSEVERALQGVSQAMPKSESDDTSLDDLFGTSKDEDFNIFDDTSEKEDEGGSASLGSIFDFIGLSDDNEDETKESEEDATESDDSDAFDVLAFLSQAAEEDENEETNSIVDDFINGTETIAVVSLEQLMNYNKKRALNK